VRRPLLERVRVLRVHAALPVRGLRPAGSDRRSLPAHPRAAGAGMSGPAATPVDFDDSIRPIYESLLAAQAARDRAKLKRDERDFARAERLLDDPRVRALLVLALVTDSEDEATSALPQARRRMTPDSL